MIDPKPVASLGSSLLARKGSARPAMRPQMAGFGMSSRATAQNLEDLGWNDMGEDDDLPVPSGEVLQLTPAPQNADAIAETDEASPRPLVRSMHDELAARLATLEAEDPEEVGEVLAVRKEPALPAVKPERVVEPATSPAGARKAAAPSGRRAAFTLRLDAGRHLKLRLASTVRNLSAQQLVTEALDRFLNEIPEIESLAAQVQRD